MPSDTLPAYTYRHRDAVQRDQPKQFTDALIASGRFWRDEHSYIQFKLGPGEYARVESKAMLRELLLDGGFFKLDGDLDDAAFDCLWSWFAARRWTFPRLNPERPWSPPAPAPVSRTGPQYVHANRVRR